jgi:hypothetical protein
MWMSNVEAVQMAFIPGIADSLKRRADASGNMAWKGLFLGVIFARNGFYVSSAVSLIGAIGARISSKGSWIRAVSFTVSGLGVISAGLAGKRLYDQVVRIQGIINQIAD